jgi:hypothetical protein
VDEVTHQFQIIYDAGQPLHRWRFSVAHELGHIFFFDRTGTPPRRLPVRASKEEERFCNQFAAELLIPSHLTVAPDDLHDLIGLARQYRVSAQVAGIQLVRGDKLPWKALIGLQWIGSPTRPESKALRVMWSVTSPGTFVPQWAKYRAGPALDVLNSSLAARGRDELKLGTIAGMVEQQAIGSGSQVILAVA